MKLTLGIAAAFVSCAAASQPAADVYILPNRESASPPSISSSIARLIALQRSSSSYDASVHDIPDDVDVEEVVSLMNQYGGGSPSLFDEHAVEPKQLFIMLEGLTEEQIKDTRAKLKVQPSFTIIDPPSTDRQRWATGLDVDKNKLREKLREKKGTSCSYDEMTNPFESRCWVGRTLIADFDIQEKPEYLGYVIDSFPRLTSLAEIGEVQTTLLLLPGVGKSSGQSLHRRQAERVISHFHKTVAPVEPTSPAQNTLRAPAGRVPACFDSLDSCISKTGNCSHQGQCLDKYASKDGGALASAPVCFACHCLSTRTGENGPLTHWAGPTCAKKDISVPFWLFATFTLLMLGTISMALTMLYNVGDEKLPGVIGAGVSKSK